jgi:hypothetical protein
MTRQRTPLWLGFEIRQSNYMLGVRRLSTEPGIANPAAWSRSRISLAGHEFSESAPGSYA